MSRHEKEKAFQKHICTYFEKHHGYTLLGQKETLGNDEHYIGKEQLLAFIKKTQSDTFARLEKDYGNDSADEIIRALKDTLKQEPLWKIIRHGLTVRKHEFKLYFPKPRSALSREAQKNYEANTIEYQDEFVIDDAKRIDIVLYLNGLPIITMELKHEDAGQFVNDAVEQYAKRKQSDPIFKLPFLHIALDTSEVKVATNCSKIENFMPFNMGLDNAPLSKGEYAVEYLYSEVLSREAIMRYLSFFLVYVPKNEKHDAFSIFPRYHQMRSVNRLAKEIKDNFDDKGKIGANYLINHSAGSGKTLTMSWTADRLHSLYKEGTETKLIDMIFILTDRKELDKNISEEIEKLTHLAKVVKYANHSSDLKKFVLDGESIIVSTVHKLSYIIEEIKENPSLKDKNIAFIVDEAHRSQDGKMGASVREPFKKYANKLETKVEKTLEEDTEIDPEEDVVDTILKTTNTNMLFVAFTATPSQNTVSLFGETFDVYSEAEAIAENYIVDVAENIIAYETLYNLDSKFALKDEKLYPQGILAKVLKTKAFEDEGLIHYKAEVMLSIFEEQIASLINGKAKAMVVTSSRIAGLRYFNILEEKLAKRQCGFPCKVLYAFSDFKHPDTGETLTEKALNGLSVGEKIQDRFKEDDYRILVVANKFQTGFNEPLLAGMFLDKAVADRNAVQTLSRLNRKAEGKETTIVVDFTNSVENIFKAFRKYREGTPFEPKEQNLEKLNELVEELKGYELFSDEQMTRLLELEKEKGEKDPEKMAYISSLRGVFNKNFPTSEEKVGYVYLMFSLLKQYHFLSSFFEFNEETLVVAEFCDVIASQLIKGGGESELMKALKEVGVSKANVEYKGIKKLSTTESKRKGGGGSGGSSTPPPKATLNEMIVMLKKTYAISEEEAIVIREICEEKLDDKDIVDEITRHKKDEDYLRSYFSETLRHSIVNSYVNRDLEERIMDDIYDKEGAILDTMTGSIIRQGLFDLGMAS